MAAQNLVDGIIEQIDWKELEDVSKQPGVYVLDVRNESEVAKNGALIDGAINLPLNDLRERMHELPADAERVVVSCASGQRAYYACRILMQSGNFEAVYNLGGAFKTFSSMKHEAPMEPNTMSQ